MSFNVTWTSDSIYWKYIVAFWYCLCKNSELIPSFGSAEITLKNFILSSRSNDKWCLKFDCCNWWWCWLWLATPIWVCLFTRVASQTLLQMLARAYLLPQVFSLSVWILFNTSCHIGGSILHKFCSLFFISNEIYLFLNWLSF